MTVISIDLKGNEINICIKRPLEIGGPGHMPLSSKLVWQILQLVSNIAKIPKKSYYEQKHCIKRYKTADLSLDSEWNRVSENTRLISFHLFTTSETLARRNPSDSPSSSRSVSTNSSSSFCSSCFLALLRWSFESPGCTVLKVGLFQCRCFHTKTV